MELKNSTFVMNSAIYMILLRYYVWSLAPNICSIAQTYSI
jgi:hypothetical protein